MAYYHSKPVGDIDSIHKAWNKLSPEQKKEMTHSLTKIKQYLLGKGLEQLDPRVSSHGEAYVYAAKQESLSLLFGSSKSNGDLDGKISITPDGKVCFSEAFKGSYTERFKGRSCRIYELDEANFQEGKTSFDGEVVSDKPAKVLSERTVKDIKVVLDEAIEKGEFVLRTYNENDLEYVAEMEEHILRVMKNMEIWKNPNSKQYRFCQKKYPHLLKRALELHEEDLKKENSVDADKQSNENAIKNALENDNENAMDSFEQEME